ncbi:MAG: subtilase, partial [Proteobacteria bacterium]
ALKAPNDVDYSKLWGMSNVGAMVSTKRGLKGVDISAERAWERTTGSKNVIVAVIDTGIDFTIPDLAPNAWTNEKELRGVAGVDDDGNGYVDDIHGYDFVNNDGDPTDDQGHGSHCAGTIGARGDDGLGVAGVNWNVSLMAVKFLNANGGGSLANAIKAIDYASKNGAKILSNSWGGGPFVQTLIDAIERTNQADQLFVAAAGNDGRNNDESPSYPASYDVDNIISVAAVDARGDLAGFSNYGVKQVDLAAPGVGIYSTVPGGFDTMNGTSMATPHVSGVAALLLAENPNLTAAELKTKLLSSVRPLRTLQGQVATGGMLDAYLALSGDVAPQDPNDASTWMEKSEFTISTPHPYIDATEQVFTIQIPGAKRISAHFPKFETENGYDLVQFLNAAGENLGTWSGEKNDRFSPIADGDTLVLKFQSDASVNAYGFDIDSVSIER